MVFGLGESSSLSKKVGFLMELTAVCTSYLKSFYFGKTNELSVLIVLLFSPVPSNPAYSLAPSSFHDVSFQACDQSYSEK